jgi:uncharacterized tellurite resistance protein B-like protein
MLRILTDLFDSLKPAQAPVGLAEREHTLQLVTAVLLIEVVRADGEIDDSERTVVMEALGSRFRLSGQELADVFELARHKSEHAHDLHSFTELINERLDEAERIQVFELLWAVAYANGKADDHEAHLLRRLADLLHIRHQDAIGAKLRAERASAGSAVSKPEGVLR